MIERVIDWSVKNSFIVIFSVILLLGGSFWAIKKTPLDALPDLSPVQVIVVANWSGQAPNIIENQVSFPLIKTLMALPNIETVRAMTSQEIAMVYIIFKDGTDIYWARSRVLEQLTTAQNSIPKGVTLSIGPDATGVGWVYQYALTSKTKDLQELKAMQDYYYRYALLGVDGVSEVASVGGFTKDYEVTLNNAKMVQYELSVDDIANAIKRSNSDSGGRIILENGFEQAIVARGFLKSEDDIGEITLNTTENIPLKIKDVADVRLVPASRRGVADLNGEGEAVGGIVVVRYGENAFEVINRVKERISTLKNSDVTLTPVYDRSELIEKAIDTLKRTLIDESLIVLLVSALFLLHFKSALVIIITLPITVAYTFLLMKFFGIHSTIMSLGGIAIAIGAMVDAAIVMVENAHKHLHHAQNEGIEIDNKKRVEIILSASKQVGRPIFFALIIVIVSFLPIFALSGQEGKLFTPMAFTKTFAMALGAILSITLVPILMVLLIRGRILDEQKNPINRFFIALYNPLLRGALKARYAMVAFLIVGIFGLYYVFEKQKWEFLPPLNEEVFMYMPVTPYGIGIDAAKEYTQKTNQIIKSFPEVEAVFGKAGRADSATDPAPLSMIETFISFKPKEQWREGMTHERLKNELNEALQVKGLINSWTYPIRGRIDMLLTGIRTPLGIKLYGNDFAEIQKSAKEIEKVLSSYGGTLSVFADRANAGYYLDIKIDESALAQYGIKKETLLGVVSSAVGGVPVSEMIDGIERYPISIRYDELDRVDIEALKKIMVKTALGMQPLEHFAHLSYSESPSVLKSEKGLRVAFIYITPKDGVSPKTYKDEVNRLLSAVKLPQGSFIEWAGQSQYLESALEKLKFIVPATILLIFMLIVFALKDIKNASIVFFSLPFAVLGGLLYVDFLNFNMSIATVVGFLALLGIAAETAIVMVIYLEEAVQKRGNRLTHSELKEAVLEGAVLRVRPKLMTVFSILFGLVPIMYILGVGSEVMQRIAAPMIGGMVSSTILTLFIVPCLYFILKK